MTDITPAEIAALLALRERAEGLSSVSGVQFNLSAYRKLPRMAALIEKQAGSIERLKDAIAGALDDMSGGGKSVSGMSKATLRYELGRDDEIEGCYAFEDALDVLIECDEMHGKVSPLRKEKLK